MTTLITNSQFKQFDENGLPLAAGKIYTYEVGTTTNKTTYQDEAKVAAHTNPIILDAWGEATIWIDGDTKFVVTDSNDVAIRTYPNFSDTEVTGEFPVVSSPQGAVLRSQTTDTGYIKVQLPMAEWPNTKMMFDVMIYTDAGDEATILTVGGYADSNTSAWLTTTALSNSTAEDITVKFGNDGTYPCIYIGAVDSEWIKPQIAVVNFLAGQFSYSWDTWDNGWDISITTSLGTITQTETAISVYQATVDNADGITEITNVIGWGSWQTATPGTGWSSGALKYRKSNDSKQLQIVGVIGQRTSTTNTTVTTLLAGFRPTADTKFYVNIDTTAAEFDYNKANFASITTAGVISISYIPTTSDDFYFNTIIALDY